MADNGATLFAAKGYSGIWGRPLDELIVSAAEIQPRNTSFTIYPNPSSDIAMIVFELNGKGKIEFSLINLNGQVVKSICKGELDKGTQRIILNCTDLPEGIYLARLQTNSGIMTQKLVLR